MINQELVSKIHCLLDKGVISGISPYPKPGNMCVEQVVCYAMGEEIGDKPSCVGKQVRKFVTFLNDSSWSSPSARAEGMRELSIAQLGSNSLNQKEFRDKILFAVITKMLPAMFRDLGEERWEKEIKSLEKPKSLKEAREAVSALDVDANADADACAVVFAVDPVVFAVDPVVFAVYDFDDFASYAASVTNIENKYLKMFAHLAVEVLKDMKSPGCEYL